MDREILEEFFKRLADKYSATELVDILEDTGTITIWHVIAAFEDELIEIKERLEE